MESHEPTDTDAQTSRLPDWCSVYEGLSDDEKDDLETIVLDRSGWNRYVGLSW